MSNMTTPEWQQYYFAPSQTTATKPRPSSSSDEPGVPSDSDIDPYSLQQGVAADSLEEWQARRVDPSQVNPDNIQAETPYEGRLEEEQAEPGIRAGMEKQQSVLGDEPRNSGLASIPENAEDL